MQRNTHSWQKTVIATLRDVVQEWMRREGYSRETAAQLIIEAHDRIGGPAATKIEFNPETRDAYERARVNADRIFRWLDDVTKDRNMVPPNFIPSVLSALPLDLRLLAGNALMLPANMACHPLGEQSQGEKLLCLFKAKMKEGSDAQMAVAALLDGIAPGELKAAQVALQEDIATSQALLTMVEGLINRCGDGYCEV